MAQININGMQLEYREGGEGEPLVFVHGSASDLRTWQYQQDFFSNYFRTVVYSRRYHWPNESIPEAADYSMFEHVDDLEQILNTFGTEPVHLVGHSYGAIVCLLLAFQVPEKIQTLVLAEPPVITLFVSNKPKPLELLRLMFTRPRTAVSIMKLGAKGFGPASKAAEQDKLEEASAIFGKVILGTEFYNKLSEARIEQININTIKAEFLGSGYPPISPEKISRVQIPTLLINGEKSPAVFYRLMDRVEELLPNAERIKIPQSSHIMHEDNAPEFNKRVLNFLERDKKA